MYIIYNFNVFVSFFFFFFFFFNDTATTEIYTLSLHDALPILAGVALQTALSIAIPGEIERLFTPFCTPRSEEHTSELQSHSDLVCRLLLEKKKKKKHRQIIIKQKKTKTRI